MSNECGIVKDLLPLYADEICSEESKALIEAHIKTCESCRAELQIAKSGPAFSPIEADTDIPLKAGKRLKKIKRKTILKCVAVFLAVLLVLGSVVSFEVFVSIEKKEAEIRAAQGVSEIPTKAGGSGGIPVYEFTVEANSKYTHKQITISEIGKVFHRFSTSDGRTISISMAEQPANYVLNASDYFLKLGMKQLGENTDIDPSWNPQFITRLLSSPLPEYHFFSGLGTKLQCYAYYAGWCKTLPSHDAFWFSNDNFSGYGYFVTFEQEADGVVSFEANASPVADGLPKEPNGAVVSLYHGEFLRAYHLSFRGKFTEKEIGEFLSLISFR